MLPPKDSKLIHIIMQKTKLANIDNISRTLAYERFFKMYPEIEWSFLASMVSRNAGWNMCDLKGAYLPTLLTKQFRMQLFITYEKANWVIFQDAYPQLLLYHYSTKYKRSLFHLCENFFITKFMEREWMYFWEYRDVSRLVHALIINEQHVIQQPVIEKRSFVFHSLVFLCQDWLHFSSVLFPTCDGELFGFSVKNFTDVNARILLGKQLYRLLFCEGKFADFLAFSTSTPPTGSRHDYEQYSYMIVNSKTPKLRDCYPIVHHPTIRTDQWDQNYKEKKVWFKDAAPLKTLPITKWYFHKQEQVRKVARVKKMFTN